MGENDKGWQIEEGGKRRPGLKLKVSGSQPPSHTHTPTHTHTRTHTHTHTYTPGWRTEAGFLPDHTLSSLAGLPKTPGM